MTAHALARALLGFPDLPVEYVDRNGELVIVSDVRVIKGVKNVIWRWVADHGHVRLNVDHDQLPLIRVGSV